MVSATHTGQVASVMGAAIVPLFTLSAFFAAPVGVVAAAASPPLPAAAAGAATAALAIV